MAAFYDFSEAERIALTERAIQERRTLRERWDALAAPEAQTWSRRAWMAAQLLAGELSVADLGCGTMSLEPILAAGTTYYPVDVVQRDHRTIICDFNLRPAPKLSASAAACLGIIEYLFYPKKFMRVLASNYRTSIVSYCPTDAAEPIAPRRAQAWVNDLSRGEIEDLFCQSGWDIDKIEAVDRAQFIWRLRANAIAQRKARNYRAFWQGHRESTPSLLTTTVRRLSARFGVRPLL